MTIEPSSKNILCCACFFIFKILSVIIQDLFYFIKALAYDGLDIELHKEMSQGESH